MGWIARVAVAVLSCLWWAPGLYAQTQDTVAQADTSATRWASDSLPAGAAPAAWPMTQRPPFNPGLAPLHLPLGALIGRRVRIRLTGEGLLEGRIVRLDRDSMALASPDGGYTLVLPRSSVTEVWVCTAERRQTGKGALIGGLVGFAVGLTWTTVAFSQNGMVGAGLWTGLLFGGPIFGAMGSLVGRAIGATSVHRTWQPQSPPLGLSAQPVERGRVALGLRMSV